MWVILLEALAALLLLIGLVWWTMFSGRRGGERRVEAPEPGAVPAAPTEGSRDVQPAAPQAVDADRPRP